MSKGQLLEWATKQKTPLLFKIVVFFLSDQPHYKALVESIKALPDATARPPENEVEEVEVPGYQYGGATFKLIFVIFYGESGMGFTRTRASGLLSAAADVALGCHSPVEEKDLYENYVPFSRSKTTLSQAEGMVEAIGSSVYSSDPAPFFLLSFADNDTVGKEATTFKTPTYFLTCAVPFNNDHLSKVLQILFLGADKKLQDTYLNLSNELSTGAKSSGDQKAPQAPAAAGGQKSGGRRGGCILF